MQADPKTPVADDAAGSKNEPAPDLSIFFLDLIRSEALLDAEEARTPRLSSADAERAAGMSDATARRLWRASRIATRIVLERVAGQGVRRFPFQVESGGRPVLGNGYPHFSVSHTAGSALIAVSKTGLVGVDLEERKRSLKMPLDRRRRLVEAAERLGSPASLAPDREDDVLTAWVLLEAVAKASGTGIGRLLTEEGVVGGSNRKRKDLTPILAVRSLLVGEDHVAAIAAQLLPQDLRVEPLPVANLAAFLK